MMRCLREVNVDNNTVGWYQSSSFGAYQTTEMIETFVSYHESIKKCVCLVYDPQRSGRGQLALKAVRLKDQFIEHFKEQKLAGACALTLLRRVVCFSCCVIVGGNVCVCSQLQAAPPAAAPGAVYWGSELLPRHWHLLAAARFV